ncbi:hypothetical protein ACFLQK_00695 [bacterium]
MGAAEKQKDRKPYEPPAVISERIFETNALVCGKCETAAQISIGGGCTRGKPSTS